MNDIFKALADATRRRILELLIERDMDAGEIAAHFDISKPSVSHHLSVLKNAGLIQDERQGQRLIYSINMTVFAECVKWFFDLSERNKGEVKHEENE